MTNMNDWREAAACKNADPDLFFPDVTARPAAGQLAAARKYCADCTVRDECLEFAMRTGESRGIWGGTTPNQRVRARRRERARQRRAVRYAA